MSQSDTADHQVTEEYGKLDYRKKSVLEELYLRKGYTQSEVADVFDVSRQTIISWMEEHSVPTRDVGGGEPDANYKNEEWLFEQYFLNRLDTNEMAELEEVTAPTIRYHMDRHNLDRIPMGPKVSEPFLRTTIHGYMEICHSYRGEEFRVKHSRLLAVAKYGLDTVCGLEVHHDNRVPWDDRFGNIRLMTDEGHGALHGKEGGKWSPKEQ